MAHDAPLYPVSLVVAGRPCLVVGGGPVAARKVDNLRHCGADVTVVAPEPCDAVRALARAGGSAAGGSAAGGSGTAGPAAGNPHGGRVTVEVRRYRPGEAAGYRLVVTATGDPTVDHAVASDAEAAGVWVNSADDVANCTFLLPAVHRQGSVTVAVSTGGASPALAGWLRSRIAEVIGPEAGVLAELLDEARHRVRDAGRSTEVVDWAAILNDQVAPLVRDGKVAEARAALRRITDELLDGT